MLQVEVLVGELGRAVDACAPRPVAVQEIAALAHESLDLHVMNPLAPLYFQTSSRFCFQHERLRGVTDYTVELGALVALRPALGVLGLAGAELAEVLSRLWHNIVEELERDAAQRLTYAAQTSANTAGKRGPAGSG